MRNKTLKNTVLSALFLAIGVVLPFFTSQIKEIGDTLLPMHIPALLCGFIYGYGLGVRVNVDPVSAGNLATTSEFGWDGAMASYFSSDPSLNLSVFHAEHVTGFSSHALVHPRLRNIIYGCIGE